MEPLMMKTKLKKLMKLKNTTKKEKSVKDIDYSKLHVIINNY